MKKNGAILDLSFSKTSILLDLAFEYKFIDVNVGGKRMIKMVIPDM